jgi:glycosyltransferase involved in cell wall biosynthesis
MDRIIVGVNLLYLKPGRVGGSEEYIARVLWALQRHAAASVMPMLFVNRRFSGAHPDLADAFRTVTAPVSGDSPAVRIAVESTWLVRQASKHPLDLVHHVANTVPFVNRHASVLTIHDLQPFLRPGDFSCVKGAYLRGRIGASARKARVIVTPSEYVRGLVTDQFGIDEANVIAVPAPIHRERVPVSEMVPRPQDRTDPTPYFLYPAITHPHKNQRTLIRAFDKVAAVHPQVELVLAGGRGRSERSVLDEIARLRSSDRVRRLGRIPRAHLDELLRRAVALTFPSHHEGYGLPVAEAMALGCPVIASNVTALPEVVGNAGLLIDPDDVDAWTIAMLRVLEDASLRATLAVAGLEQVRELTPARTARRSIAAYTLAM